MFFFQFPFISLSLFHLWWCCFGVWFWFWIWNLLLICYRYRSWFDEFSVISAFLYVLFILCGFYFIYWSWLLASCAWNFGFKSMRENKI
jgi:hypothetical protein